MVVCNLHLVALSKGVSVPSFLSKLHQNGVKPMVQARILRWMILPTQLSSGHLLGRNMHWDLLLTTDAATAIPSAVQPDIEATWTASCGVSARTLSEYATLNAELLNPPPGSVPHVALPAVSTSSNSQHLEFSPELSEWITGLPPPLQNHPVSMLNLLAFKEGRKGQYVKYGTEFSSRVGASYGGKVKIAARVVDGEGQQAKADEWEEIAFVHYPSVKHFAGMASSQEYQEVNRRYRLGALRDTFIMCVVEVDDRGELLGGRAETSKL
ncbi:hypothetical protein BJ170DRAFT_427164 [Xylariales sp. AK1849]|nr:hypothetical protein BJ170DRAFT_427164 [Xylariales sp. AK1849]